MKTTLIVEQTKNNYIHAEIVSKTGSISLGFRKAELEEWISWKGWLKDLAHIIGADFVNKTNFC